MSKIDLKKIKKVGVFGGSFDPVTTAHIKIADLVLKHHQLEHILFLPNFQNPLKSNTQTKPEDRVKLLELALKGKQQFSICNLEIDANRACYTFDTILQLKKIFSEDCAVFFIHGSDCLDNLARWHRIDELLSLVHFVIVGRTLDFNEQMLREKLKDFNHLHIEELLKYAMFVKPILLSSTDVRQRIKNKESVEEFLDPLVYQFIKDNRLYDI